mmetsp:Transcript_103086/g.298175  ORF Transcript_103086/g.298175 Transcript_103086/m.298175 type:complete len:289 (+) Transcript_103086:128-994(+)
MHPWPARILTISLAPLLAAAVSLVRRAPQRAPVGAGLADGERSGTSSRDDDTGRRIALADVATDVDGGADGWIDAPVSDGASFLESGDGDDVTLEPAASAPESAEFRDYWVASGETGPSSEDVVVGSASLVQGGIRLLEALRTGNHTTVNVLIAIVVLLAFAAALVVYWSRRERDSEDEDTSDERAGGATDGGMASTRSEAGNESEGSDRAGRSRSLGKYAQMRSRSDGRYAVSKAARGTTGQTLAPPGRAASRTRGMTATYSATSAASASPGGGAMRPVRTLPAGEF